MTERGMIFNADMVRAVLDGRKTQTRRMLTPRQLKMIDTAAAIGECYPLESGHQHENSQSYYREWCPFGGVGDRLWVRETFAPGLCTATTIAYRATHKPEDLEEGWYERIKWTPSIHMPRWASRITLEITGVRVERLASVSKEDARAEGYPTERATDGGNSDPWLWFRDLWDGLYPEQSFKVNPWVWVIEFKRVEDGSHE